MVIHNFFYRGYLLTAPTCFFAGGRESLCITFTDINFDQKIGFSLKNPDTNATFFMQKEIFQEGKMKVFKISFSNTIFICSGFSVLDLHVYVFQGDFNDG